MNDARAIVVQRLGHLGIDVVAQRDADRLDAERPGPGGEIRIVQFRPRDAVGIMPFLVGADGAVAAIVGNDHLDLGAILHGGGDLLAGHQHAAVADEHDGHAGGIGERRRDGAGHAEPHGAGDDADQQIVGRHLPVAMHPGRHVAGIERDRRGLRRLRRDRHDHLAEINPVRGLGRAEGLKLADEAVDRRDPRLARRGHDARRLAQFLEQRDGIGDDAERRVEYFADGIAMGVDMDQRLGRHRGRWERVIEARHVAQPGAHGDDQIGARQHFAVLGRIAEAQVPGIERRRVVEHILVLPGHRHRNALGFGETPQGGGTT